jgi:hypothetical protein
VAIQADRHYPSLSPRKRIHRFPAGGSQKGQVVNDYGGAGLLRDNFPMSIYRKAFLIWWTPLVLFIAYSPTLIRT